MMTDTPLHYSQAGLWSVKAGEEICAQHEWERLHKIRAYLIVYAYMRSVFHRLTVFSRVILRVVYAHPSDIHIFAPAMERSHD